MEETIGQYKNCWLCPRDCGADRYVSRGVCGEGASMRVARAAPHFWEEPCISGERGSGAIFFSGCALHCVYCQNGSLSRSEAGLEIGPERLGEIMLRLRDKGVHNINFVTASHFAPGAVRAIELAKDAGLGIPVIWNSSGYEKPETLKMLDGLVDVYLPDFKYFSAEHGGRWSKAPDYREWAEKALAEMFRQTGPCRFDGGGMIKSGVIVRHLCLPGAGGDAMRVIKYLHDNYGEDIYISIMSQYTPQENAPQELRRKLSGEEYRRIVDYAVKLGVENGFTQEGESAKESFIPEFDLEGLEN